MKENREQRIIRFLRDVAPAEVTGAQVADNTSMRWWQKLGRSNTYVILARLQRDGTVKARWLGGQRYFRMASHEGPQVLYCRHEDLPVAKRLAGWKL